MEKRTLPYLAYNWTSAIGVALALVSGVTILFLLLINLLANITNPYLGILLYMVLPGVLITGLLLIPLGMYLRRRTVRKTGVREEPRWPAVDLNDRRQRNAVLIFLFGTLFFVLLSSVGMYQTYHFTDSVLFCGRTCHRVMHPEYTAYQHSPHARVKCVECHIGPGANWYVKSKLSGAYQVYATLAKTYQRPIPTPIQDLRPARETCEECHWPRYFIGDKQLERRYYRYDRKNTRWPITLVLKVGGGGSRLMQARGIHWHVGEGVRVEYLARDRQRQEIPWVRLTDTRSGTAVVYEDTARPLTAEEKARGVVRVMDCLDCHNRPSHNYPSPDTVLDAALAAGLIDATLPEVKKITVQSLAAPYPSSAEALSGIAQSITGFYRSRYPEVWSGQREKIDHAVSAAQAAFRETIFPGMRARWSAYPNNIGHFLFPGCMRCHGGAHAGTDGSTISADCRSCHAILRQGGRKPAGPVDLNTGLVFEHPVDIGDAWKGGACYQCHTGVQP